MKDRASEEKSANDLIDLRNRVGMVFLFSNITFVLLAFVLQFNVSIVYIPWPCPVPDSTDGAAINDTTSKVDPMGITFLVIFGVCLIVQFVSMLIHRFNTFLHIISTTKLQKNKHIRSDDPEGMVELVQRLGTLREIEPDYENDYDNDSDDSEVDRKQAYRRKNFMEKTVKLKSNNMQTIKEAFLSRLEKLENMGAQSNDDEFYRNVQRNDQFGLTKEPKTRAALMTLRNKMKTIRHATPDQSVFANNITKNGSQIANRMYTPHNGVMRNTRKPSVTQYSPNPENF